MISESHFENLATIRKASKAGQLGIAVSKVLATGEPCALVVAIQQLGNGQVQLTPFGILDAPIPVRHGQLSPAAKDLFAALEKALKGKTLLYFDLREGKVHAGIEVRGSMKSLMTMTWGNPYELFADPTDETNPVTGVVDA